MTTQKIPPVRSILTHAVPGLLVLLCAVVLVGTVGFAFAAERPVAPPSQPERAAAPHGSQPVIEVNRAEAADGRTDSVAPAQIYSPDGAPASLTARPLSALMQEIRSIVERDHVRAGELADQVAAAADEETIIALQREMEALAQATELDILRAQARHARLGGRLEVADRIDQAIAQILSPFVPGALIKRPVPNNH